ncbi:MAG: hypothetical protein HQM09_24325 [Candidatus Riflebacteria bacterium]|nr:hypothetical protein [Candidatus Riflebacteria bacterium]
MRKHNPVKWCCYFLLASGIALLAGCLGGNDAGDAISATLRQAAFLLKPEIFPYSFSAQTRDAVISWKPVSGAFSYRLYSSTQGGPQVGSGTWFSTSETSAHMKITATPTWVVITAVDSLAVEGPPSETLAISNYTDAP